MSSSSRIAPVLLTSRTFGGSIIPSTTHRNLSWNNDGQCLFIHRKSVVIATPYLSSTLPPPPVFLDSFAETEQPPTAATTAPPRSRKGKGRAQSTLSDAEEEGTMEEDPGEREMRERSRKRVRRANGGDVKWWITGVEAERTQGRDAFYCWGEAGNDMSATVLERERYVRSAIWSPSGLSDLGSSLLVIMMNDFQVSVYCPQTDSFAKQYIEIADLTTIAGRLVPKKVSQVERNLELRATCMEWSPSLPLTSMLGKDGSLLAIPNRAGKVALWSYGSRRRFLRLAHQKISDHWVGELAWSAWSVDFSHHEGARCEASLAMLLTDGSICTLPIARVVKDGEWDLQVGEVESIDPGDKRAVTAMKWVGSGSVHLWSAGGSGVRWQGAKSLTLERVGDWAGCNALNPCVGIHSGSPTTLFIVLSSLTHHLVTDLQTDPKLAPSLDSLRQTVATRDVFLAYIQEDFLVRNRFRVASKEERGITAHTSGWSMVGDWGNVMSWVCEPMNFHNLDATTESNREMNFIVADLGFEANSSGTVVEYLSQLFRHGPSSETLGVGLQTAIHRAPNMILLPVSLHLEAMPAPETAISDLMGLVKETHEDDEGDGEAGQSGLMEALWGNRSLDTLRIKYVLAISIADRNDEFDSIMKKVAGDIEKRVGKIVLEWTRETMSQTSAPSPEDWQFLLRLSDDGHSALETVNGEKEECPACKGAVDALGKCTMGHTWSRCSITRSLITTSNYRVCTTCPCISLIPRKYGRLPIAVTEEGVEGDYKRFELKKNAETGVLETVLEAAKVCVMCGGRWMRVV
ncbi:general transcription factor 3C polypeptide 4, partial [Tremellales sp. Uapishka_1]